MSAAQVAALNEIDVFGELAVPAGVVRETQAAVQVAEAVI